MVGMINGGKKALNDIKSRNEGAVRMKPTGKFLSPLMSTDIYIYSPKFNNTV